MRAVTFDRYGPPEVLRIVERERPVPKDDEVLVRVRATTASRSDAGLRSAEYFIARAFTGWVRPKGQIVGLEFAGEVEATGAAVTKFAAGDRVFGVCNGSNAEYVCVREAGAIALVPDGMPFEQAAAVADGALSAISILRSVGVDAGQRVVVYGASGSIGTAAVQVAKYFGAHVTAVCNTKNVELVRSLGADAVVDYLQENFTRRGETYDVIFDAAGKYSFLPARRALKPGGVYVTTDPAFMWSDVFFALLTKLFRARRRAKLGIVRYRNEDLALAKEMLEAGKYRPVIDRTYALDDVVEAHRYVDTHQKTGNVVLTVAP